MPKITKNLDSNKAHGHDEISIRVLLQIIKQVLDQENFP